MKFIRIIFAAFINAYMPSADPNLFGIKSRSKQFRELSDESKASADKVQSEIDALKSENPFESAAAKSAMAKASSTAKQMQTRMLNAMGGNTNPEAMVAVQGNTNEALGSAAGKIATGAEALKKQETNRLRGLKLGYESQASGLKQNAISEQGSGWRNFISYVSNPLSGALKGGSSASQ